MVVSVAWTTYALGWEAAKDLHDIAIPRDLLGVFRIGIERCIGMFKAKAAAAGGVG